MTAMEGISWKRAYAGSLLVHLAVAGLLGSVAQHEQEKMYVVDLDASELTDSGSGHAGGGEGGGSAESLFPDKLSETDVAQRTAAVEAQSLALTLPEQAAQARSLLADAAEKAAAPAAQAPSRQVLPIRAAARRLFPMAVPAVDPGREKEVAKAPVLAAAKARAPAMARAAATAVLPVRVRLLLTAMASGRLSMPINPTRLWPSSGA